MQCSSDLLEVDGSANSAFCATGSLASSDPTARRLLGASEVRAELQVTMTPKGTDDFAVEELEFRKQAERFGSFPTEVRCGRICNSCCFSKVLCSCKISHAFLGKLSVH